MSAPAASPANPGDLEMTESPPLDLRGATISDPSVPTVSLPAASSAFSAPAPLPRPIIVTPTSNVIKKITDAQHRRDAGHGTVEAVDWTQYVVPDTGEKVSTRERVFKGEFAPS